ncbi:MAG: sporulation protein YunB [Clostridia bacterium]|nr:sporulation protein YunB [Clostridia bacterium]
MDEKIYTRSRLRLPDFSLKKPQHSKNASKFFQIFVILFIALTVVYFSLQVIEPIMETQCVAMAKSIATKISNDEATKVMENYSYDDLLNIIKDEQGNIKMVETNIITVNQIISAIPTQIQETIENSENNEFQIRLGSLLGNKFLAGRGPNVNIKMDIAGTVDTELKSEFVAAGINQTLHKIYLELKCNVVILTPINTIERQITNQVLLAEGVIVGEVPNAYYHLQGISQENAVEMIE